MAKDIKNLKEVVSLVLSGVTAVKSAQADGKIGLEDLALLITLVPSLGPALEGLSDVPAELSDLSAEEVAELAAMVIAAQSVDDAKAKALISGAFKVIGGAVEIIQGLKA